VLTALGAEQAVETLHWSHRVEIGRAALRQEMGPTTRFFAFRVAVEPCVGRRLDALDAVIETAARHRPVTPLRHVRPDIFNAVFDSIWRAQNASQVVTHFDDAELNRLGLYYQQVENIRHFVQLEDDAWSELSVLDGDPGRLGPEDFAQLRSVLQRARFYNHIIALISSEEVEGAKALTIAIPARQGPRIAGVCAPL